MWVETSEALSKSTNPANVCMGGDWYTFPSHFFLPTHTHLSYVEDNFHGLLPQRYDPSVGTQGSVLPVNDLNAEEKSRYVDLQTCDYLVMTTPSARTLSEESPSLTPLQQQVLTSRSDGTETEDATKKNKFNAVHCEVIIDAPNSPSALFRAFFIPFTPPSKNEFMRYCLYAQEVEDSD